MSVLKSNVKSLQWHSGNIRGNSPVVCALEGGLDEQKSGLD